MTNYTKATNFATKDALASGNALKILKGTEIDTEFNNIATAVATKADLASPTFTGTPTLPTGTIATTQAFGNSSTALATTAFVQAAFQAIYPVGSIYINASVGTNPATLLGFGTWTAFGSGKVMIGDGGGFSAGATGGSYDATLVSHNHSFGTTTDAAGSHQHSLQFAASSADDGPTSSGGVRTDSGGSILTMNSNNYALAVGNHQHTLSGTTGSAGSSATNANLQPYIVVYMWNRTA